MYFLDGTDIAYIMNSAVQLLTSLRSRLLQIMCWPCDCKVYILICLKIKEISNIVANTNSSIIWSIL